MKKKKEKKPKKPKKKGDKKMAAITITIPDAVITRVLDALSLGRGYQTEIPDPDNPGQTIPNPASKANYAKAQLKSFVRSEVRSYESVRDGNQAAAAAITIADSATENITVS